MDLTLTDSFKKIKEKDIATLEKTLQLKLPADYISFLLQHNGGCPTPGNFTMPGNVSRVRFFYGITGEKLYDLAKKHQVFNDRLPLDCITIATDQGGNQVVLHTRQGQILFFNHETEELVPVADNFQVFIDGLYEPDEDESEFDRALNAQDLDYFKRRIASEGLENIMDEFDRPAVQTAAVWNKLKVLQLFAEQGADLKGTLFIAAQGGHTEIVRYLLGKGVNVDDVDEFDKNETALLTAAHNGHLPVVKLLIEAGADIHAVNEFNQTLSEKAALSDNRELVKFVKSLKP